MPQPWFFKEDPLSWGWHVWSTEGGPRPSGPAWTAQLLQSSLWRQCVFGSNPLLPGVVLVSPTKGTPWFSACRCLHSPVPLKSQKWWEGGQRPATEASLRHHTGEHHRHKPCKEYPWWGGKGTHSREASWVSGGRCGWWAAGQGWAGPFLTCQVTARQRHKALGAAWDLIWAQIKLDGSRVVSDSYKKWVSRTENTTCPENLKKKKNRYVDLGEITWKSESRKGQPLF